MANASREAVARWRADHYRFQVYQYEACHLVQRPDGQLRVPSVMEREKLMGFSAGYVSAGVSTKITVAEAFNLGACMIGNSFNVYCISFLLDELLAHCDKTYVPRQLDRILSRGRWHQWPGVINLCLTAPHNLMRMPACWFKSS